MFLSGTHHAISPGPPADPTDGTLTLRCEIRCCAVQICIFSVTLYAILTHNVCKVISKSTEAERGGERGIRNNNFVNKLLHSSCSLFKGIRLALVSGKQEVLLLLEGLFIDF